MDAAGLTIAVVGGTGAEGGGIALRLAKAGHRVIIGSRDAGRAAQAGAEFGRMLGAAPLAGMSNREAAKVAEIVVLTVPYAAQRSIVEDIAAALAGKILIDATAPLVPPRVARVQLPTGGSAVAAIQDLLGGTVRVVSAFQNVAAHKLRDLGADVDCDVLVCADDGAARQCAIGLCTDMGLRGIDAGPLANSAAAEALTSVLIAVNRQYKVSGSGIRITGLDGKA
jgi:NADPH-dependent F420 reductase